nr:augmin subunit 6 [Tanacetum cinerariifolium]
ELVKYRIADGTIDMNLQHSAIWVAGVYLMILMQFLKNKVAMELTPLEVVEAQERMNLDLYFDMLNDYDGVNGFISAAASNYAESKGRLSFYDVEEIHVQVFSPPFLMDASLSVDSLQDLLAALTLQAVLTYISSRNFK